MKLELTCEQIKYKDEFNKFVNEIIIPEAAQIDRKQYLPREIIKELTIRGYLGLMIDEKYGGKGADAITIGLLNEELGRGCTTVRNLITVHGMVALAIQKWASEELKNKWLPKLASGECIGAFGLSEPEIGSNAQGIKSTVIDDKNHYVLNGSKKWITMAQIADVFLVFAKYDGKPTAFLVERDTQGFNITPIIDMLGARGSMVGELNFCNCKILKSNIVGSIGTGLSHVALSSLDYGRYTIAWGSVGLGQACINDSIVYASKREQFGNALKDNQLIQKMITEMVVNVKAARQLCYKSGYLRQNCDPESIMETWVAKYFASKMINQVASNALQIHGANGCCSDYPIERYFRDARINEIIEGTSQMHEILIANNAMRGLR
ncbi:hypothetical protein SAMN04488528_10119 [Clostridium frigidicarnis]|uniref:Acyl-CoA dehydrogenase n=1 Tax=Clostridium frigidicarnis TaxID=84698 RepID=A0A1I0Y4F3_9CLOT|nr:acyl-CoA dehydrogenase family protein [Clostridium frigidicarnis]SFB07727.1 hypothetical protein SAMN04488528_10119 [Clostridium frigidicarnis]